MNVGEIPPKSVFGTGGGFGRSVELQDSGSNIADRQEFSTATPSRQKAPHTGPVGANPGLSSATSPEDCHYFLQGTCTKVTALVITSLSKLSTMCWLRDTSLHQRLIAAVETAKPANHVVNRIESRNRKQYRR